MATAVEVKHRFREPSNLESSSILGPFLQNDHEDYQLAQEKGYRVLPLKQIAQDTIRPLVLATGVAFSVWAGFQSYHAANVVNKHLAQMTQSLADQDPVILHLKAMAQTVDK